MEGAGKTGRGSTPFWRYFTRCLTIVTRRKCKRMWLSRQGFFNAFFRPHNSSVNGELFSKGPSHLSAPARHISGPPGRSRRRQTAAGRR
jgi:hypothetical protein